MSYVLIIGAKSDIAKALAKQYASHGYDLYLAARQCQNCEPFAKDLSIRNQVSVNCLELDVCDLESHQTFYDNLPEKPEGVISVAGYLGEQEKAQNDPSESLKIITTNYTGLVSLLNIVANDFEQKKQGFIVGISSVAGDRGRQSNYLYGSAKAAFSTYLSGLRNRLSSAQVNVLTVKPGFVATKMTAELDLPPLLTAQADEVALSIYQAQLKARNVLYTKPIWWLIMLIIKHVPEFIFKKTDI